MDLSALGNELWTLWKATAHVHQNTSQAVHVHVRTTTDKQQPSNVFRQTEEQRARRVKIQLSRESCKFKKQKYMYVHDPRDMIMRCNMLDTWVHSNKFTAVTMLTYIEERLAPQNGPQAQWSFLVKCTCLKVHFYLARALEQLWYMYQRGRHQISQGYSQTYFAALRRTNTGTISLWVHANV